MFDLLFAQVLFGCVFTFGKQAVINSSPFFLTAVRLVPAGLLFLLGTYLFDRKEFYINSAVAPTIAGVAFFFFLMDAFRFVALQHIPASHAALVNSLAPFIAALFATLVFKEKLTFKKLVALCIGFCAVLPLIVQNIVFIPVASTSRFQLMGGYAVLLIATISAVIGSFFLKKLVGVQRYSIFMAFGTSLFAGGIVSLICSLILEPWNPLPLTNTRTVLPIIGFLFVAHNLIAQPLFGFLVRKYPVTLVTFATLITPLSTCVMGWCCYGHQIGNMFIVSLVTLMASFYLFYHEEKKERLV